jgi:hypothetical protein
MIQENQIKCILLGLQDVVMNSFHLPTPTNGIQLIKHLDAIIIISTLILFFAKAIVTLSPVHQLCSY